ncbi:hypothetical protein HPB50_014391 [Hyalomma asiaticum]|uniref:Uncharacterized protein n=1 Tax=Hyalomma asiaticum TaxID=266040 RepID=A0ACB7SEI1_HYAAI|nr:hypothetical protein HPB50_014391 [Hyalomma asiaticum]
MTIALAIMNPATHTVLSDSKSDILSFIRGSVGLNTSKIPRQFVQRDRAKNQSFMGPRSLGKTRKLGGASRALFGTGCPCGRGSDLLQRNH